MTIPYEAVQAMPCPRCASENVYIEPDERGSGSQWVFPVHIGCNDCGINLTCNEAETVEDAVSHWNERALPFLTGVNASGLDWKGYGDELKASAFGISAFYRISGKPDDWTVTWPGEDRYVHNSGFKTQAEAKAAAFQDYQSRILSALEL